MLTLLLVSVYKLLLNYFHQLLLRPHLHPEQATVPGSRLTILPSPSTLPCRPGLACWQDLHFRRRQTFHLHCFCQCLCLQCLSPANPPLFSSPVSTRIWTWYESSFIAHRVQKLIYCCGGGGGGEDFYNFCVSFCLVFHFVWLSISKFSCLCYCLPPITPSETYWKYPMSIRFKFLTANKFYDFNMVKWFIYPDFSNLINSL